MRPQMQRHRKRRGIALMLLAAMIGTILIPIVGLAVDGTILYMIKTKLSASVDAAALAGARSLSVGVDLASQTAASTATVNTYFAANFPSGFFGTSNPSVNTTIDESVLKTRTVLVQAGVDSPLYFLRIFGVNSARVNATGQASRRDVNVILVLDRSSSMQSAGVCGTMINSATSFVDKFTEGRDRLGLVTFMAAAHLDYTPTVNFKTQSPSMETKIGTLVCGGNTGTAQALNMAYTQIKNINEPGSLNVIVFFTDGLPNGTVFTNLPIKTLRDDNGRYSVANPAQLAASSPRSTCTAASLPEGVIVQEGGDAATGDTSGIFDYTGVAINSTSQPVLTATGCSYNGNRKNMRQDIANLPGQDAFGNLTTGYTPVETYPNGPYVGLIRVDTPSSIGKASKNAADNQATTIRNDASYKPVIYCIGLGGTSAEPLDDEFLQRVANDPASPIYNSNLPTGMYVYAPSAAQLTDAFNKVASEILRLSL